MHTHSFVEVAVITAGTGTHLSLAGRDTVRVGDVVFLRPGVWHGYDCHNLELYNCGLNPELLYRELVWAHEDPVLGYLLWTAPLSTRRRGLLTTHLDQPELQDILEHTCNRSRICGAGRFACTGDVIARLTLVLGHIARAVAADRNGCGHRTDRPSGGQ